jgi:MATE family multidrug resistance protein
MLSIAVPTILQMASYTVQQFTDILMLSRVGDVHATAAGTGGIVTFCFISFGFGILMLVNAMVGQAFGAGRFKECGQHLWQGIWMALLYAGIFTPFLLLGKWVFEWFDHPQELQQLETVYFEILMLFLGVKMLAGAVGQFLLAIDRPNIVLLSAVSGVLVNIVVNYVLIYGHFGFPAMGIAGAAWGTNIGVCVELLILCSVAFGAKVRSVYNTSDWSFDRKKFTELFRTGLPSGFQVTGDVLAWTIFLVGVMGLYGPEALAANNYMIQYMKVSFMPAFGFGTAVSVLVARYVGAQKPDVARHRAWLGFQMAAIYMILCGLGFVLISEWLMKVFTEDPQIIRIGQLLFVFCAIYQLFDAMFIIYSNALRGVKDTFWPSVVQISLCWSMVVGGGWLLAFYKPEWGVGGPWTLGTLYGVILGLYLMLRFHYGRWQEVKTDPVSARVDLLTVAAVEPLGK